MLYVHEIHSLDPARADEFETALRSQWVPAIAEDDCTRLTWAVRSIPSSISSPELITLTAVTDGAAMERLGTRMRSGDLRDCAAELEPHRRGHTLRLVAPLEEFNAYEVDLDDVPLVRTEAPIEMYIHDFVIPRLGMQREYETQMRDYFMKHLENRPMRSWAGFETVAGGGRTPESVMVTHVNNSRALAELVVHGHPRVAAEPGTWMSDALKLRDTWICRLVRSLPWSPTS